MKNTNVLGPHFGFTSVDMSCNKHMMIPYSSQKCICSTNKKNLEQDMSFLQQANSKLLH